LPGLALGEHDKGVEEAEAVSGGEHCPGQRGPRQALVLDVVGSNLIAHPAH